MPKPLNDIELQVATSGNFGLEVTRSRLYNEIVLRLFPGMGVENVESLLKGETGKAILHIIKEICEGKSELEEVGKESLSSKEKAVAISGGVGYAVCNTTLYIQIFAFLSEVSGQGVPLETAIRYLFGGEAQWEHVLAAVLASIFLAELFRSNMRNYTDGIYKILQHNNDYAQTNDRNLKRWTPLSLFSNRVADILGTMTKTLVTTWTWRSVFNTILTVTDRSYDADPDWGLYTALGLLVFNGLGQASVLARSQSLRIFYGVNYAQAFTTLVTGIVYEATQSVETAMLASMAWILLETISLDYSERCYLDLTARTVRGGCERLGKAISRQVALRNIRKTESGGQANEGTRLLASTGDEEDQAQATDDKDKGRSVIL